jgi:LysM repeat protein
LQGFCATAPLETLRAMRTRTVLSLAAALALAAPGSAAANFVHTVTAGESLSSVAAQDGLSVDQLAAANGLSPDAPLIAGTSLSIPPQGASTEVAAPATTEETAAPVSDAGTSAAGGYVVQPGDTLSAIAAAHGISVDELASMNGLDPNGVLLSGSTLSFSGSDSGSGSGADSAAVGASGQPIGLSSLTSGSGPNPTAETVSASDVGAIAADAGVPASFAQAIGYQESGFNNDLVSSTGARGVMQIEPGTWDWIQNSLAGNSLSANTASDNVRGGVLMLRALLQSTGGNEAEAAAGYYQGLASVQQHGMYADTQNYVNNVMALTNRFGGG